MATITLDVPGKFNRVSMRARDQLAQLFDELGRDDAVRVVVVTGAGDTFTAGGDIVGFLEATPSTSRVSPSTSPRRSAARSR